MMNQIFKVKCNNFITIKLLIFFNFFLFIQHLVDLKYDFKKKTFINYDLLKYFVNSIQIQTHKVSNGLTAEEVLRKEETQMT